MKLASLPKINLQLIVLFTSSRGFSVVLNRMAPLVFAYHFGIIGKLTLAV
jgi:hypothetical protein